MDAAGCRIFCDHAGFSLKMLKHCLCVLEIERVTVRSVSCRKDVAMNHQNQNSETPQSEIIRQGMMTERISHLLNAIIGNLPCNATEIHIRNSRERDVFWKLLEPHGEK